MATEATDGAGDGINCGGRSLIQSLRFCLSAKTFIKAGFLKENIWKAGDILYFAKRHASL